MRDWCYGVIVSMHAQIGSAAGLIAQKVGQKDGSKTYDCLYTDERTGSLNLGQIAEQQSSALNTVAREEGFCSQRHRYIARSAVSL